MNEIIQAAVKRHLLPENAPFVLGVSGGPDSMAMLHAFGQMGYGLIVAHVNYKKRPEADHDEAMVRSYCEEHDIECRIRVADPQKSEGNFQNWARDYRRGFFKNLMDSYDAAAIVTAHHKDDQLETVFQKILRGSSLSAWTGIPEYDGVYLRPLLSISKQDLVGYAEAKKVPYRIDKSNLESTYARNFIRNEWKPELDSLFPGWQQNILRLTQRAEEYHELLEILFNDLSINRTSLDRAKLLKQKPIIRKAVVLEWVSRTYPDEKISASALDNLTLEKLETGQVNQLNAKVHIMRDREVFTITTTPDDPFSYDLSVEDLKKEPFQARGYKFSIRPCTNPDFQSHLYLDCAKLPSQFTFRSWGSGDRFQPLSMRGTKKVADFLTDKKVSSAKKNTAGVLVSFDGNVCAVIFPSSESKNPPGAVSEGVRCEVVTKNCLVIERITQLDE